MAFVALTGFVLWQHTTISSLNGRVASLTQELNALRTPRAASRPTLSKKKIICPLCHGEKVVVYTAAGETGPLHKETQACPVCAGVGYRMLKVLPGYKICPDCKGMGIVYLPEQAGHRIRSDNCGRCGATGLIAEIK